MELRATAKRWWRIAYAAKTILRGKDDFILAGGMEAPVTPYALLCCNTSGVLTQRNGHPQTAYRPFDKTRDGFAIAEGAGVVILESPERVQSRKPHVYANIIGYGTTTDGVDRIHPASDGRELARAIQMALEDAGVAPSQIDYICADGAGTLMGDISETRAIKSVFNGYAKKIPVSAPKSVFGNMLGACGAVDVIMTVLAMENGMIPPTINYSEPDPECDLDYIPNVAREKRVDCMLKTSSGFSGIHSAMVLRRYE